MPTDFRVGGRIRDTLVPLAGGGPDVPLRGRPREGVVLLFPRRGPRWDAFVQAVVRHADAFADWDGRAIVVAGDADPERAAPLTDDDPPDTVWVVRDPAGVLEPAATDGPNGEHTPVAVIADRFGEIYHVWEGGESGPFPEPREIEEWLRFLALQCPE